MQSFEGKCVGGPFNGQMLAHWSRTKTFYRPGSVAMTMAIDDVTCEAVNIGEYRLNDYGQWHWWPTKEGDAMDTLYGKPQS